MIHLLTNSLLVAIIIFFPTLCGLGLLQILRVQDLKLRILLAPSLTLTVSAILVALVVVFEIPAGRASSIIWVFWIVFAIYGSIYFRSALIDLEQKSSLWIPVFVTFLVSAGYLWYGLFNYLGSPALDGWSYVSFGEYLRVYPKGVEGGLAPLYQYASHLSPTRFVASALLGVLIPPWSLSGVDTQMTVGPLLIISIFSTATSLAYVAHVTTQRGLNTPAWLVVFFGVVGGWLPHALRSNNYDNLLALPLAPLLFALGCDRKLHGFAQIVLPGIVIAASIYIYPELSPLIILAYGLVILENLMSVGFANQQHNSNRAQIIKYTWVAIIALFIVSPYLREAILFFSKQLSLTNQITGRPGEGIMPGLLDIVEVWGLMWGLSSKGLSIAIGIILFIITIVGVSKSLQQKYFALVAYLSVIAALFAVMVTSKHYDYGAYKILLVGFWALTIVLSAGLKIVWDIAFASNAAARYALRIFVVLLIFAAFGIWVVQQYQWAHEYKYKSAKDFREARNAVLKTHGIVQVLSSEPTRNAWLVYMLRDAQVLFPEFHGYMDQAHVRPLMVRSKVPDKRNIEFLLTERNTATVGNLIWQNDLFKLIKGRPDQQPPQITISAPNGREELDGVPFFWIGKEPASVIITTSTSKSVQLVFEAVLGPSLGDSVKLSPNIIVENSQQQLLKSDMQSTKLYKVNVKLLKGANTFIFRNDYSGRAVRNSNGDPRILFVGIKVLKVTADE